jgi:hypothetical protein
VISSGKYDIREGKSEYGTMSCLTITPMEHPLTLKLDDLDLEISLNYGQANGAAPLLRFVTEHTEVRGLNVQPTRISS